MIFLWNTSDVQLGFMYIAFLNLFIPTGGKI